MSADLVITGGRVIDPMSELDTVADVAVTAGRITAIGSGLDGNHRLRADGLIVAPGFIDLHSHVHSIAGHRLQAHDGVTTALDLEAGASPVSRAYTAAARAGRPLNYGFSASWTALRMEVLAGIPADGNAFTMLHDLGKPEWQRAATSRERDRLVGALERELGAGALGVGVLVGYAPDTDPDEYLAVADAAAGREGRCSRMPASSSGPFFFFWMRRPPRSFGRRPRPGRTCTTATSTARRAGTSTGC